MRSLLLSALLASTALAGAAHASSFLGNYGTLGANGVVTAPPSGSTYGYVSTDGGVASAGTIAGVGDNTSLNNSNDIVGSSFQSDPFTAGVGDTLRFYFNYVTSDGSGFADYGWAQLRRSVDDSHVAWLFTGRTQPSGDIAPGFGLPALDATLTPATSPIIAGGPIWSPLGDDSGDCFVAVGQGCGYTGWIESTYNILVADTYTLNFGVTNWDDNSFHSGLAFAGARIGDTQIDVGDNPIPAPASLAVMGVGLLGLALRRRRRA
jgi:hypothetical protein